jgi:hypothetical protein
MKNFKVLFMTLSLVLFTGLVSSQTTTSGAAVINVKSSEGSVAGASVSIENTGTGLSRAGDADDSGSVRFASLPPGDYKVTASAAGYSSYNSNIRISTGTQAYNVTLRAVDSMDEITVTASIVKLNTYEVNETGLNIDVADFQTKVPVGRDLTSITLLAPGAVQGDGAFGFLPSFGGSSVAENQYLVNGLNITNFRNFTGFSNVPFEFYETVDVKTGGFQAQYGKAIGGFVTANTKRGSNDFEAKVNIAYTPDSLRDKQPDTRTSANTENTNDSTQYNLSASGAILQDKLFYYVLAAPTVNEQSVFGKTSGQRTDYELDEVFYGAKIDYYLNDSNILELTYFTDNREVTNDGYAWDSDTNTTGAYRGSGIEKSGGDNTIVNFTSFLTDSLTLEVLVGKNEYERTTQAATDAAYPPIYDNRTSLGNSFAYRSDAVNFYTEEGRDEREQTNVSLTWDIGNHIIKVGVEQEDLKATQNQVLSGGSYILLAEPSYSGCAEVTSTYCVRVRTYSAGGTFELENSAMYIQDSWNVSERLNLNLGLRSSDYKNMDANGGTFIEITDQVAYRIGATYDLFGDGKDKISAFIGKYYLPIAANTNIRLAGGENYVHTYHNLTNEVAGGSSILQKSDIQYGPAVRTTVVGDGKIPETYAAATQNIEAMYQDEIIFGYTKYLDSGWTLGAYYTYRDLASAIDDILVDHAVNAYCARNGIEGCEDTFNGPHGYVLANPGVDIQWRTNEIPGTDGPTTITLTANDLAFPTVQREYAALDLTFDKAWDGEFFIGGNVTISSNRGNYEGTVKSDNGQDDAGLTQDFDFPEFMDNSYGYLPNHRAFKAKLYGATYINSILVGANFSTTSPRKYGCIGNYPGGSGADDNYGGNYWYGGNDSWACNGVTTPRGQSFDGKWINQFDLSFSKDFEIPGLKYANVQLNIFNILDFETPSDFGEYGESDGSYPDQDYRMPTSYQAGRSMRLNFVGKF